MRNFAALRNFVTKIFLALSIGVGAIFISSCEPGGELVEKLAGVKGSIDDGQGVSNESISFTPSPYDFGDIGVGASGSIVTISVRNVSKVPLKLKKINAPVSSDLTIESTTCSEGQKLTVDEICTVRVQFKPTAGGRVQDKVVIDFTPTFIETNVYSNQGDISGHGVAPLNFAGVNPIMPADVTTSRVTLRWPSTTGASSYVISEIVSGNKVPVGYATSGDTSYVVSGLTENTFHSYRVNALNVMGVADANSNDQSVTMDAKGSFAPFTSLSVIEGGSETTPDIGGLCTDSESNHPQMMVLNSQSDPDLNCVLLTSPFRISCSPGYKAGMSNWSGNVSVGCLLNDYPIAFVQQLTVNVSNTFRPITISSIFGQNVVGGSPMNDVQASASSPDGESIHFSCQYDLLVDGSVSTGAAPCTNLINYGGGNATFTSSGLLQWTPQISDGAKSFEFKITAIGDNSGLAASTYFVVNVGYPPPSPAQTLISAASSTVKSGLGNVITLTTKDSLGRSIPVGGAAIEFGISGGTSTGIFSPVIDNGDGTYTSTFSGVFAGTATTITARVNGSFVTSVLPTVQVLPGDISPVKSTLAVSAPIVFSGNQVTITLQAKDAVGNNLNSGGDAVVFSRSGGTSTGTMGAVTYNGDGSYSTTFTGVLAGTPTTIGATVNGGVVSTTLPTIQVNPGAVSLVQSQVMILGSPLSLAAGNAAQIKLVTKDAAGNLLQNGGLTVTFTFSGGSSQGSYGFVTDAADGSYTAALTGTVAGTPSLVRATIGGVAITSTLPALTITPGGASVSTSLISVSSATVSSGNQATVTMQVRDAYGNNLQNGGETVTFSRSGGGSTGTISGTTDVGNGSYTATFTGVLAGTPTSILGSISGAPITTTLPTITVVPGAVSLSQSAIVLAANTVASGSQVGVTLQTRDAAGNIIPGGGKSVVFSRQGGASTGTFGSVSDNLDGTYSANFLGVLAGAATSINATIDGSLVTHAAPSLTVIPGPISPYTSTLSVGSSTISSGSNTMLTLQAKDAAGNSLIAGGANVIFSRSGGTSTGNVSATTDHSNGSYTAGFTGVIAGSATSISATINGTTISTTLPTITVTPGVPSPATSNIFASSSTVQSGSSITLTVQTKDAAGNNIGSGGQSVFFSFSGGTSTGTISPVVDNGDGSYSATFTAATSGTPTNIVALINSSPITTTAPSITVTPGPVSLTASQVILASNSVASGSSVQVTLQLKDAAGNNVQQGGKTVVFSRSGGTSTGSFSAAVDHSDGTYTSNFTGVLAGTATTVNATVDGTSLTSVLPTVSVTPGPVSPATSIITTASSTVSSGNSVFLYLQAKDAAGNNLTNGGAVVAFTHVGGTSTGALAATTDNGNGTYTGRFTGQVAGTATTIHASIGGAAVTTTFPTVTVSPGAPSPATSFITVANNTVVSGSNVLVTLQARDAIGNDVGVGGSTVLFAHSGGASTGTLGATTDVGNGTYNANFTGVLAGTGTTISATLNGSPISSVKPSIAVTPGALSLSGSIVSLSANTVSSGSGITATLEAKDAAGNTIPIGGETVVFNRSGGTSTGTFGSTTDNTNGTYSATFTGAVSGTATTIGATVSGNAVTSSLPTLTVTPGAISATTSTMSVSSASVISGNTITVTLQGKDASGNNLTTSGGSAVVFTHTGGTSTGTLSAATDNGNGTYSATFTAAVAGTATTIQGTVGGSAVGTTLPTVTVSPGAPSAVTSVVTLASSTVSSGSSVLATLQAKDAAGNNVTVGGATVVFSHSGGTSTGSVGATTDVGNGTYTASFTGVVSGSATTVSATVNGTAISTAKPFITVTPGAISLSSSLVSVSSPTVASGLAVSVTLQAKDAAGNIISTGGETVVFNRTGGTSTGTFGATTDNNNGTYTASFTGTLSGTATAIGASVGGSPITSSLPTLTVIPGVISAATSTISLSSASVVSGSNITVTLQAKDAAGNSLTSSGSTSVAFTHLGGTSTGTFSAAVDQSNGTYTATFTGAVAGTATSIRATIGGAIIGTALPTVTVSPGAPSAVTSVVTLASSTVASGSSVLATLQAKDASGNNVAVGGATVVFSYSGGTSTGSLGATTDVGNGTYTALFTGILSGSATSVGASVNGTPISTVKPGITVTPGSISLITSLISMSSSSVVSGSGITATLQAKDAAGNNIPSGGETVVFNRSGGTSTGTFGATTDNTNGTYSATFTGAVAGTATTIGATVGGNAVTSTLPAVTVTPGAISAVTSTISVSSASVISGNTITVTLQGKDASGNNLTTSGGVAVVFTHTGGTSTGTLSAATDNGNGTYSSIFTGAVAGTATSIRATVGGVLIGTSLPTVTVSPGAPSAVTSVVTLASSTVASGSSVLATLQAKDASGNNVAVGGATVVFSYSGGTSTGSLGATTDEGNGTYTALFTGILSGSATSVGASVNGTPISTVKPGITVTPGSISLIASLISMSSSSVVSGSGITATLLAKDAAGNNIPVGGETVAFNRSGGTSTGTFGATTDNTNGTYSATFTGAVAGTATTIGATVGGNAVISTLPAVTVTPGAISATTSTISVSSASVISGNTITVTLQGKDASGNNLTTSGGSAVVFTHTGGTSTGTLSAATDNGNGTYSATFTGAVAGTATSIRATLGGVSIGTSLPTVTVSPGAPTAVTSVVTLASNTVGSGSSVLATLQVKDASGNNVTVGGATVVFNHSGGTSTGSLSATTDVGNGTYTASFTGVVAGSATTVSAVVNGTPISTTKPSITVTPGAISLATSVISIDSSPSSVASGSNVTLRLTAKDAAGNSVSSGGATVGFVYSGGTSTGSVGSTQDLGNGAYTATFTGAQAGTAVTIGATIAGLSVTSTPAPTLTVIPGPASAATSIVSLASGTVASGLTTAVSLQAKDAYGNNISTGGATVSFSHSGGTSTGTLAAAVDQSNGTYTSTFTGVTAGTPTTVRATLGGVAVSSTLPTVSVIPGPPSLANSLISVSSASVTSGNSITVTLTTYDAGNNALTAGGQSVAFTYSGGTSTGSLSAVTDNANGTYSATFTGVISGSSTSIRATIGGAMVTSTAPAVTVNPGAISASNSTIAVNTSTVSSGGNVAILLTARDSNNNRLLASSSTIVFSRSGGTSTGTLSSTTNNGDGTFSASFTGLLAGTATTITATIDGTSVSSTLPTVTVVPGAISLAHSTVSVSSAMIASGSTSTVTLQAKDSNGNNLTLGGSSVVFSAAGGTSTGTFGTTTDIGNGNYTSTFTGVLAGTATTVQVAVGGNQITTTMPTITVTPGTYSIAQSVIALSSATVSSGSSVNLTLTAKDAAGNNLHTGGLTVVFSRSGGTSTGNLTSAVDNNNGTYSGTFTGLVAGTATFIRATINGTLVTSSPTVTVQPGAISLSNSSLAASSATVASGYTSTLTLTVRDANNNLITSGGHTVVFSRSGGTSTGNIGATTDNGDGTYTATFTGLLAGTVTTIGATINSNVITSASPSITVIPGAISLAQSLVTASSSTVASGNSVTLTLTTKDESGNLITSGGSTAVFSISGGTSSGTMSLASDNGDGTYSATFTGSTAGTATMVGVTIGGITVSSTMPSLTVIPGPVSVANSTIAAASSSVVSGTATTLTLTAYDGAGNRQTTGGLSVVFSRSGGTSTGNIGAAVDNNNGTYTASFNGIGAGTATTINATIGGVAVTSSSPTITVIPGAISAMTSVATVSSATVQSGSSVTLTLQGKDVNGNNLTGGTDTVVFSRSGGTSTGTISGTTNNGDGTYTASFNGLVSGTATTIRTTVNGSLVTTASPTITVNPGALSLANSLVSLSSSTVQSGTGITVTLTAKDSSDNLITTGGRTVLFNLYGGSSTGTFGAVSDNANGTYTATFTGVTVGTPSFVSATANGSALTSVAPQVQVLEGAFSAANSILSVTSSNVAAGSQITVRLMAHDVNNNDMANGGANVVFSLSGGTSNGTLSSVNDNNDGTYTAVFTGTTVGSAVTLGASYNGVPVTSTGPTITVSPGPISLSQSVASVSAATVTSGASATLTLTAKDAYGNSLTSGGRTVAFSYSSGTSTGTISGTTDGGNGTYSATFTGAVAGSASSINVTVDGNPLTSATPTITVAPGAFSLANSLVQVSSTSVVAGNNITVWLQAKDAQGNNLSSGGLTVAFERSGGGSSGTFGSTSYAGAGVYSASFTGTTAGSATSLTATINGSAVTTASPTVTVSAGSVSLAQSTISTSSSSVASGANATLTLSAKDAYGNNISSGGLTVAFNRSGGTSTGNIGLASDNGDGTYSATFTGVLAGTATTIGAQIGGGAVTSSGPTVSVTSGAISVAQSLVSVSSATVSSGGSVTLTLQAKDAAGNTISSGGVSGVVFTQSGGTSSGTIGSTTDNSNGSYSALFTGATAGTATTIGATIGGVAVTTSLPTITVGAGAVSLAQSTVNVSSGTVSSGSSVTVTLTAKDAAGNRLTSGGLTVGFARSGGVSSGTFGTVSDVGDGTYTAAFTGTTSGSATILSATIGGAAVTSTMPTVTVAPGPYSLANSSVTLSNSSVASGSTITVTLTVRDASNNQLNSGGLVVAFNRTGGTSNGTFGTVADNGNGTYSATFEGTTSGTATSIGATINAVAITSAKPTATVTPGAYSLAQSTVSLSTPTVASGSNVTLTLQTKDSAGNNLTSGGLTVAFTRSGGSSNGTIGPVSDNSDGTYTAVFTGTTAGTAATIGASISSASILTTLPTITVVPGPASLAQSVLTLSANTLASGTSITATLRTKDSSGNNLTSGGLVVTFARSGGTSTGSFGAVSDNGDGTYSSAFTGAISGTATVISANIGGVDIVSALPQATVTPGAVSLATSTVAVSASAIASGASSNLTLFTRDAAGNSLSSGGLTVAFSYSGGTSTGTVTAAGDSGNGTYTASFTGVNSGSATSIAALIGGSIITSTLPTITVNPGSSAAANSTITLSANSLSAGNSVTITLVARDAQNNTTSGGASVSFTISGGTSSGNISAVTDNLNGTYTATLTGTTAGTSSTVGANIDGVTVSSTLPTFSVTPGVISATHSVVTASASSVKAGNTILVTLQAKDNYDNLITTGGQTIAFARSGGVSSGVFSSVTDNLNGTYSANFQGTTAGTPTTITATIGGNTVTTTLPTVAVSAGDYSISGSTVTLSSATVSAGSAVTVTLQARDSYSNNIPYGGLTVSFFRSGGTSGGTFGSVTDNSNGTYTAQFTGVTSGTATSIGAYIAGSPVTSTLPTLTVNPGAFSVSTSVISASSNTLAAGSSITLTMQLKDLNGNNLTSDAATVAFTRSGGVSNGNIGTVSYNGSGSYVATFTGTTAGTATDISATINGVLGSSTVSLVVVPGTLSLLQSTTIVVGSSPTVASASSVTVRLTAKDGYGNQLNSGGLTVHFTYTGGTSTGSFGTVADNNDGTYTSTFTGAAAGSPITIRGDVSGVLLTSTFPSISVIAGSPSLTNTTVAASSSSILSGANSTVTMTVKDAYGNNQTFGGLTTTFNPNTGTSTFTSTSVADNNNGTYSSTFTGVLAGTATKITGRIAGVDLLSTAPTIQVSSGAISPVTSFITLSSNSVVAGSTITATMYGRDAAGNDITAGGASVVFSRSGGTSTGNFSVTPTDYGNGDYATNFQGLVAGSATAITATVNTVPISTVLPLVTVIPGSVNLAQSTIAVSNSTLTSGTSSTITVTVKDLYGNPVTATQTVALNITGGTSTGTTSSITNNQDGTYTATFTGVLAGTAKAVNATIGGSLITSTVPTITVVPGTPSLANSSITITGHQSISGNTYQVVQGNTATLRLITRDSAGNLLVTGGYVVSFSLTAVSGSSTVGTISAVTDNLNGTYSATFTGTAGGTASLNAMINGAPISYTPQPSLQTLPLPILTGLSNRLFDTSSPNPVVVGSTFTFDVNDSVVGGDTSMSYACVFDKIIDDSVASGSACSSLPGSVTFSSITGQFSWTPSSGAWGSYEFKITGTNLAGSAVGYVRAQIQQAYPTSGLLVDLQGDFATSNSTLLGPGVNGSSSADTWMNLNILSPALNGILSGFAGTTTSGWAGSGLSTDPLRLMFNGTNNFADLSTQLSSSDWLVSMWVKPTNPRAITTASGNGNLSPVLFTNGGLTGGGISILQSPADGVPASGGPGSVEMAVGGRMSWNAALPAVPYSRLRLNEATFSGGLNDTSGLGRHFPNASPGGGSSAFVSTSGVFSGLGDSDSAMNLPTGSAGQNSTPRWLYSTTNINSTSARAQLAWEFWFKTNDTTSTGRPLGAMVGATSSTTTAGTSNCSTRHNWQVFMDANAKIRWRIYDGGADRVIISPLSYADTNWHHVVATMSSSGGPTGGAKLYIDGVLVGSNAEGTPWNLNTTGLYPKVGGFEVQSGSTTACSWTGASASSGNSYSSFAGSLDEVHLYVGGTQMTEAQIAARANPLFCRSTTILSSTNWYNVAVGYRDSNRTASLYINGVPECSAVVAPAGTTAVPTQNTTIGANVSGATYSRYWTGGITDLKIFNDIGASVSAQDQKALDIYNATSPRHP